MSLGGRYYYNPHLTGKETYSEKGKSRPIHSTNIYGTHTVCQALFSMLEVQEDCSRPSAAHGGAVLRLSSDCRTQAPYPTDPELSAGLNDPHNGPLSYCSLWAK